MKDYNNIDIFWRDFTNKGGNPYLLGDKLTGFSCLFVHLTKDGDYSGADYPIALGYMASLVRMNGGRADIHIQKIDDYHPEIFAGYDLVCFFPMSVLLPNLIEMANWVKSDFPDKNICLFNSEQHQHEMPLCAPKAAELGKDLMRNCEAIDFILIGEAEYAFVILCREIFSGNNGFSNVPSCLYRIDSEIETSSNGIVPVDMKYLPYPARDYLELSISDEGINTHSPRIQSSRGCVSSCLYCVESSVNVTKGGRKRPWLGRDLQKFVDEIELLSRQYGVVFFNVIDSSFEDPGKRGIERMRNFYKEIIARDIHASFKVHFRMETFDKLDNNFLRLLKDAGVDILVVGVESGVDNELRSYNKITSAQKNIDNVRRLDDFGEFYTLFGYMMFSPYLELEDLPQKVDFLKKIHRGWDYLNMSNNLLVFRGTAYHDFIVKGDLELDSDELSTVIPYRYIDERVKNIAEEMGDLRKKCPEVISLQNMLYDALNLSSRYYNKINRHLWMNEAEFQRYKSNLDDLLTQVENTYTGYFLKLVELARRGWSKNVAEAVYNECFPDFIHSASQKAQAIIEEFINSCNANGLSTSCLYLKTWMSLINTETNTASGEMETIK